MIKEIPDFPSYFANDKGEIFREKPNIGLVKMKTRLSVKKTEIVGLYRDKVQYTIRIPRLIAKLFLNDYSDKLQVDHINGNQRDNRIENLRMLTASQNRRAFAKRQVGTTSKWRGVCWHKHRKKWITTIKIDGKTKSLGYYDNEIEAAIAYNKAAIMNGFELEALNISFP